MFRKRHLLSEKQILDETSRGVILEIRFEGEDNPSRGHKMVEFINAAMDEHKPAAIVFNLLGCRAIYDNDVGSMATAFRGRVRQIKIPCSFAIKGGAAKSLRTLVEICGMNKTYDIYIVDSVNKALEHARQAVNAETT